MFIRVKDPKTGKMKNIGVSLKKDGQVFVNNGGWNEQTKKIVEALRADGVSEKEIEDYLAEAGVKSHQKQYDEAVKNGAENLRNYFTSTERGRKELSKLIPLMKNPDYPDQPGPEFIPNPDYDEAYAKKIFGTGKGFEAYQKALGTMPDGPKKFLERMVNGRSADAENPSREAGFSGSDSKAFAKIVASA